MREGRSRNIIDERNIRSFQPKRFTVENTHTCVPTKVYNILPASYYTIYMQLYLHASTRFTYRLAAASLR